jgi:hypothetical protein
MRVPIVNMTRDTENQNTNPRCLNQISTGICQIASKATGKVMRFPYHSTVGNAEGQVRLVASFLSLILLSYGNQGVCPVPC